MPKLINRQPKYRKHKASGQALVTIGGRDHYLGAHGTRTSRQIYDQLITEWKVSGKHAQPLAALTITVVELCDRYATFAQARYDKPGQSSGQFDAVKGVIRVWCKTYGATEADAFGPLALKATRQKMIEAGWSRRHINSQIVRIRRIMSWGAENELIQGSRLAQLKAVKGLEAGESEAPERKPIQPASQQWIDAIRPLLTPTVRTMLDVQLATGQRPGEMLAMTTGQIDRTGEVWVYRPSQHKNLHRGQDRQVFIGPRTQEILLPFLRLQADEPLFKPSQAMAELYQGRADAACGRSPSRIGMNRKSRPEWKPGDIYDVTTYRKALWRACDRAFPLAAHLRRRRLDRPSQRSRLETVAEWQARLTPEQRDQVRGWKSEHRINPHQLRHTSATQIRARYGLEAAQAILGHKRLDVSQVYAEKNFDAARRIAGEVG